MPTVKLMTLQDVRILFVDDEPHILSALRRVLGSVKCMVFTATSGKEGLALLKEQTVDVVVSDMRMPGMSGEEFLSEVALLYPDTIRMVLTGHAEVKSVLMAINQGRIWGYLEKPWDNHQLIISLEQAVSSQKIYAERQLLKQTLLNYQRKVRPTVGGFIGKSVAMQAVYRSIGYCAPSNAAVFITGASGTGKEVAAQAIHQLSRRSAGNFVALNCAAIPKELMESEIFGHVKGAYSGALSNREGAAAQADGGTLFFDEIGEMDIGLQAKLLRFIQTGQYQRVGSDKQERVDIRFVCATNRNPLEAIKEQRLREDLYYRLNVVSIHLPNLCGRDEDAVLIANFFLKKFSQAENKIFVGLDDKAEAIIRNYSWPGNVRQLQNAIYSGVVMGEGPLLGEQALRASLNLSAEAVKHLLAPKSVSPLLKSVDPVVTSGASIVPLDQVERLVIENAINLFAGNVVNAAGALGVSPSTLYRKIHGWQK